MDDTSDYIKKRKQMIEGSDWIVSDLEDIEKMTDEELIQHQLAGFIPTYRRADLPKWYDFIMENKEYVTKDQLIFLLDKMEQPKKPKSEDKIQTLSTLNYLIHILSNVPDDVQPIKPRQIMKLWYDNLDPKTNYEIGLKNKGFYEAYRKIYDDLKIHFPK